MIWQTILHILLAILAGGAGLWFTSSYRIHAMLLLALSPPAVFLLPPDIAAALAVGALVGVAFFQRSQEGIPAPNERLGWRRAARDALAVDLAYLTGIGYSFRQRATETPAIVLGLAFGLVFLLVLCYFHATARDIPRRLRIAHGYTVGLTAFIPWPLFMAGMGWRILLLGFFSFFLLPPFFLATIDLKLERHHPKRRRHWRTARSYHLPGKR